MVVRWPLPVYTYDRRKKVGGRRVRIMRDRDNVNVHTHAHRTSIMTVYDDSGGQNYDRRTVSIV